MSPGTLRFQSRPLAVSAAGATGAALIHVLLVLSFVLSLSLPSPRRPDTTGAGASALVSAAEPGMTVVFIDEPSPVQSAAPPVPPVLASRGMAPRDLPLVVLSPDPSPPTASVETTDSDDTQDDSVAAEATEHARLYGRYLGQLQARIERAWMRPRTQIGARQFSCRTRIQQDRRGAVVEVTLDHCNGTERWQQSLLSAIRTASPLPAPPDASVYADVLWLSFSSESFRNSASAEGFEPESRPAELVYEISRESFERFAAGLNGSRRPGDKDDGKVLHLTIIGSPSGASAANNPSSLLPPQPPGTPVEPSPQ